ncbi:MAG: HAD family hydrolase [Candidatus Dependentiae bacterium]|jgi:YrbI family 3-deoxy-D-manno-octulosonate 8-phosphate phosphatase
MSAAAEKKWFDDTLATHQQSLSNIRLIICDVDGCLTNGRKHMGDGPSTSEGDSLGSTGKSFHFLDGLGIRYAQANNIKVALVSGDNSNATRARAAKLGIPDELCRLVHWSEKADAIRIIQATHNITPAQTVIVGDDIPDLLVRKSGGLFVCPSDALFYIQNNADLVLPRAGGHGAVRLLIDVLLMAQGNHPYEEFIK